MTKALKQKFVSLEWKDEYRIGVKSIDEQHQHLVEILAELKVAASEGKDRAELSEILNSLVENTILHFKHEEDLMSEHLYLNYLSHKRAHEGLLQQINDLLGKYKKGYLSMTGEILDFLTGWLKNHMVGTDKQLGAYLKEMDID